MGILHLLILLILTLFISCSSSLTVRGGCGANGICYSPGYGGNSIQFYKKLRESNRINNLASQSCYQSVDSVNFVDIEYSQAIALYRTFHMEHEIESFKTVEKFDSSYKKYIHAEKDRLLGFSYKSCIKGNDYVISIVKKSKEVE